MVKARVVCSMAATLIATFAAPLVAQSTANRVQADIELSGNQPNRNI